MNTPESLQLVGENDPILRETLRPVTGIESQVKPFIAEMMRIMNNHNGVGLAANQVGLKHRFFVSKIKACQVMINPEILEFAGGRASRAEGCLSFKGRTRMKGRHKIIKAAWTDLAGTRCVAVLHDFEARIFQHELDHLNGVCLF